jgi:acid phosphatase type 7
MYETWWQRWFQMIQNATSQAPYMASVGNHEVSCRCIDLGPTSKFTVFKKKFLYPGSAMTNERGSGDNMWYSFDLGPVHFVSFSTESDYPGAPVDLKRYARAQTQLQWMAADLVAVNRSVTPFVVVMGHRPIYVDSPGDVDSAGKPAGQAAKIQAAFEQMFHDNQVDVFLAGHTHMYQRTLPMFNNTINWERGMVEIIAGGGGSIEGLSKFRATNLPFMASRWNATTSYGILDATETQLVWNCYSTDGDLVDHLVVSSKFQSQ